jgi:hypothetical protein
VGPLPKNDKGDRLAFGELPIGKFMAVGLSGGMLRKTNAFETPGTWSVLLLLISTFFILSAAFQLRAKAGNRVRRLAKSTLLGYVLVLAALLIEWQWGVALAVMKGSVLLPALWRLALHVGVVLLACGDPVHPIARDDRQSALHARCVDRTSAVARRRRQLAWRVLSRVPAVLPALVESLQQPDPANHRGHIGYGRTGGRAMSSVASGNARDRS